MAFGKLQRVTTSSLIHARHSTSVPRNELGQLVNYVQAFTKVRFMAGKSSICGLLLQSLRPGQPRLDSGRLPAGWFPLPDAVKGLLGCHPFVPPLSVFVDLRAAWVTSAVVHVTCVLSWAIEFVTSTVRKDKREVYDTLLLTPMKTFKISGRKVQKALVSGGARLPVDSLVSPS